MTKQVSNDKKIGIFSKFLNGIEKVGNKLPDPVMIFFILCAIIMVISLFMSNAGISVIHPGTKETLKAMNLLSVDQLKIYLGSFVGNFQNFPPLGLVLVVMMGAGIAEKTKFMETAMRSSVIGLPKQLLTFMIFFIGICANAAGDAGFIILPPLAAIMFLSTGRSPIVGIFAAFAGVAAGFSANLVVNLLDVLLASFTLPAAQTIDPNIALSATMNWYFLAASTLILTIAGTLVTEKIVAPRFENDKYVTDNKSHELTEITHVEKKALKKAYISVLIYVVVIVAACLVPINGKPFMVGSTGSLLESDAPFMTGIVPLITFLFFIPGLVYGIASKQIRKSSDAVRLVEKSLSEMGGYILLAFAASQFIALFNQSNIGIILAVKGAEFLRSVGLTGGPLFVSFIIFCGIVNLFIGSSSAKWAMLAPIFIPMFMLLGYDPAATQMAYRIGDSITNPISPLFPYFPMVVGFASKYKKDIGMGTIISSMLPYSIVFGIIWIIMFLIFFYLGLPFGPA
ncbi:AbgT family transporter [Mycoplasma sp. P36-A1]|uniref:AbgT family transporter n=1 Tax=Mycoplasma sp. P36-A1 TaxID=3252900 RepID=UPI003C2ADD09